MVCGPQLSSSDVATMTTGGGLTCLRSLSLSFTPISPKALHQLSGENTMLISHSTLKNSVVLFSLSSGLPQTYLLHSPHLTQYILPWHIC